MRGIRFTGATFFVFVLDNMVKLLYLLSMERKENIIRGTVRELMRVASLYSRIEELPIPLPDGRVISTREAHTIELIGNNEGLSVTRMATRFGITPSAASQMVTKLVRRGFVGKRPAPHSNKEFELFLTPSGREGYRAHEEFHGKDMVHLLEQLESFSQRQIVSISVLLEVLGNTMARRLASMDRS